MNKSDYFVFLDIDGTLWDWEYRLKHKGKLLRPESMNALNYLLDKLSESYNVKIVMTSKRRQYFKETCKLLYDSGLDSKYNNIDRTPWEEGARGKKILEYMKNQGCKFPQQNNKVVMKMLKMLRKKIFSNYVVLDDDIDKITEYIPRQRIISPNMDYNSLDLKMVKEYLSKELENNEIEK